MVNAPEASATNAERTTPETVRLSETLVCGKNPRQIIKLTDLDSISGNHSLIAAEVRNPGPAREGPFDAPGLLPPPIPDQRREPQEMPVAADTECAGRPSPIHGAERKLPTTFESQWSAWSELEVRSAGESWQSIVNAFPDAVLVLDAEEVVLGCNRAAAGFFGHSAEHVVGQPCRELFRSAFGPEGEARFGTIKSARLPTLEFPLAGRWFRCTVQAIAQGQHRDGWVWTIADITAHRLMKESSRRLQQLEAAGQVAGGFAHEINNLFLIITSSITLVLQELSHSDARCELLRSAEVASVQASQIFRQLLGQYRPMKSHREIVDLNTCVGEAAELLRGVLGKHIQLQTDFAEGLYPILADPRQIMQVLLNLCLNARDAMSGQGTVSIQTANDQSGKFVCLQVSDTGPGISAEILPHIFEPFFTTKGAGQGTGLGLTVVQGFVQDHGGWIECRSPGGAGASFLVYLPRGGSSPSDKLR
jgi:two-component system cell cycle sensor histidine kinase/response regulator CckA